MIKSIAYVLVSVVLLVAGDNDKDENSAISVAYNDGVYQVIPGYNFFSNVVAWANFSNSQLENGWMFLEVSTSSSFPDDIQAFAAGYAEGYLTSTSISYYYREFFLEGLCKEVEGFCDWMKENIDLNEQWVEDMVELYNEKDPYWHMVQLFYKQMDGISKGLMDATDSKILGTDSKHGVRLINFIADVWDYVEKYKLEVGQTNKTTPSRASCSVLIKHVPERGELYVGHNAWHEYSAMGYRYQKRYNLNYRTLPGSDELVPGHTATMSSYAGSIFSVDDFVTLSSGLVTTETTLFVYKTSLFKLLQPDGQLMEPVRVMVANRLATSGQAWTAMFAKFNSGTYNNQWMVIDYNQISSDGDLKDGTLWVLEQLPGEALSADQTHVLRRESYWASYNRAFYPEIFINSGAQEMVDKHGSWFSYSETPRAKIMARDHSSVTNEETMIKLMRYNNFQEEPFAIVPGCPKPIPAGSIANRDDLTAPDSDCEWAEFDHMVGHRPYGALDMKMVTRYSLRKQEFHSVAGPTHSATLPPFSWTTTNLTQIPLYTPIKTFNFHPHKHQWDGFNINDAHMNIL